jgi:trans-AT polyketide synthase/acyltransferase/oxidoreductase domain-containing protein
MTGDSILTAWLFPGQGAQQKGMGLDLFRRHRAEVRQASDILGWRVDEMCASDPDGSLRRTEIAQPAIFVVDALAAIEETERSGLPAFVAGHSLGEYAALFAAGCFDFATGVQLVRRRGELMAAAPVGCMAAIVGADPDRVARAVAAAGGKVDVANYNSPDQTVLSGPEQAMNDVADLIDAEGLGRVAWLPVSGAFHSRLMAGPAREFARDLAAVKFRDPMVPVIANCTALPYRPDEIAGTLARQIDSPVRWAQSMAYLSAHGVAKVLELGPGAVLTSLWRKAKRPVAVTPAPATPATATPATVTAGAQPVRPEHLGSAEFRRQYGVRYAYAAGSMYHGISSTELVSAMGRAGLLAFFGTGGLPVAQVDAAITRLRQELGPHGTFGVNLLNTPDNPALEEALTELYLRQGVRFVEAAAYPDVTAPLVRWRFTGARLGGGHDCRAPNQVLAKVSRPEVAAAFMSPAPEKLIAGLLAEGKLTAEEAEVARRLPVAHDVCVECDSAGHTDRGNPLTLMPAMLRLRDEMTRRHRYASPVRVGVAGGLGTPEAIAVAFLLGADFVLTGSVNQCTVQAGTSDAVKDILATLDVSDTAYAPAGDMFELGAVVQVVRKGTLFPARAGRLAQVYRRHRSWADVGEQLRGVIEDQYFGRSFEDVWADTREYLARRHPDELARAERDEHRRMALVFRWYFRHSTDAALTGDPEARVDYQIHCGPAMGAFNRWVAGTELADWRARDVADIADRLMRAGCELLATRITALSAA